VDTELGGETMQFVDVVGQQVRPLQNLPAPNRIIHVKRHVAPADIRPGRAAAERIAVSCRPATSHQRQARTVEPAAPEADVRSELERREFQVPQQRFDNVAAPVLGTFRRDCR
jgi:hypothetical protein